MKIKMIYIDDDNRDLKKYKRKFEENSESKDKFIIKTMNVQHSLENIMAEIEKEKPELILVDFDLTKPKEDFIIGMTGTMLSTVFREKFRDIPLVLFTRKSVFNAEKYFGLKEVLASIDEVAYKHDIFKATGKNINFIYDLAVGYKKLRQSKLKNWSNLLRILQAPVSDQEYLKRSDSPIFYKDKTTWSVPEIAKWIRYILIKYPGILYDSIHAATYLGISEKEFLRTELQDFFEKAKYKGAFAQTECRWWKSQLSSVSKLIMDDNEIYMPLRKAFPVAWKRVKNASLEKSKCIFSDESPAEWICYILKKPVMIKYSLGYYPDSRPSVMDEARVSFKAIKTSNDVNDELFDNIGKTMLKNIRNVKEKKRK